MLIKLVVGVSPVHADTFEAVSAEGMRQDLIRDGTQGLKLGRTVKLCSTSQWKSHWEFKGLQFGSIMPVCF